MKLGDILMTKCHEYSQVTMIVMSTAESLKDSLNLCYELTLQLKKKCKIIIVMYV